MHGDNLKFKGFSLTEMIISMVVVSILILGISGVMADGIKAWHTTYDNANSDVLADTFVAQKAFERIVRPASYGLYPYTNADNTTLDVYYKSTWDGMVDRRAHFYTASKQLKITYYNFNGTTWASAGDETVCSNVSGCKFNVLRDGTGITNGRSAQMVLTVTQPATDRLKAQTLTTVTSAFINN